MSGLLSSRYVSGDRPTRQLIYNDINEPPFTPNSMDDEFRGTSLDTSKWTWLNQGSSLNADVYEGQLIMFSNENVNQARGIYQSVSGNWTFRCAAVDTDSTAFYSGIFAADGTTGEVRKIVHENAVVRGKSHATPTSSAGDWGNQVYRYGNVSYMQMSWDGTTLTGSVSFDGQRFHTLSTLTPGYTPSIVGLAASNSSAALVLARFLWFRKVG